MDPFTAAMLAGTALQMYGNYKANMDEARAEAANQSWMMEQQAQIKKSTEREIGIYNRSAQEQMASLENAFAKSGISMQGSAMALQQQNELFKKMEIDAIISQGDMQMREASFKIGASQAKQSALTSGSGIQGLAIGLQGAGAARQTYLREKGNR